jgi:hypothetical protein
MSQALRIVVALLMAAVSRPVVASAQESNFVPAAALNLLAPAGWSITPGFSYSGSWDDNALIVGTGDAPVTDILSTVNPRASVDFNGRRGQMSASYDGAFVLYRELSDLNSYDQHATFVAQRLLSPHVTLFVRNSAASVPTTELSQLVGVPFSRTGSKVVDVRGGIEAAFSKRTTMTTTYDFQWVKFDEDQPQSASLRGGHSNGGSVALGYRLSERFALTADYQLQYANVEGNDESFNVQNIFGGVDYKLSTATRMFFSGGVSRLTFAPTSPNRTGPAARAGITHQFHKFTADLQYSRSFVPSYGFGGTTDNAELSGRLRVPFGRRGYATSALSWRRNDPLTEGDLPLRSYWLEAAMGYAVSTWVSLEAFYGSTHQTIDRPGGQTHRNRVGLQVITAKPLRIR